MTGLTRRRTLTLIASATAAALLPAAAYSAANQTLWRGTALGAKATILLDGIGEGEGKELLQICVAEIERLEGIFSLYRTDSTLTRLNARALVTEPEQEFVELISRAKYYASATDGAFDPTVQPLWIAMDRHFRKGGDAASLTERLAPLRPLIDHQRLGVEADRVWLEEKGMAVTLNGIAQGYITDRIAELLRRAGLRHVLVDLGEKRALGEQKGGRAWKIGLKAPDAGEPMREISLTRGALATSGGYGHYFDQDRRFHHLLDPNGLSSSDLWLSMSVQADTATEADALSTAFSVMPLNRIKELKPHFKAVEAIHAFTPGREFLL